MFDHLAAIAAGAVSGAVLRHWLSLCFARTVPWFAFGTLAANWLGAYLIGITAALLALFPNLPPYWRPLLITGFLGSLTTLSGLSLEVVGMLEAQRWGTAAATVSLHLFGSLLLTALGIATIQAFR